jgi:hypothetical protein
MAQTVTTTNASTTLSNSSMISGNPIFIETDKSTNSKSVVING